MMPLDTHTKAPATATAGIDGEVVGKNSLDLMGRGGSNVSSQATSVDAIGVQGGYGGGHGGGYVRCG